MTNNKEADSQMQRTVCRDVCREHMYVENVCMYVENRCREPMRKWEKGRGHIQVGILEMQSIMCEINYKDILYNTGSIANFL